MPPVLIGLYVGLAFDYSFGRDGLTLANKMIAGTASKTESVVGLLESVDGILLVSVLVLIIFGTCWLYIMSPQAEHSLPSALQHLTSGKLKEKLASSLITASAVYLFKIVIQLTSSDETEAPFDLKSALILGAFHALFILGYFVIAQSNRLDPHKHPQVAHPDKPVTH